MGNDLDECSIDAQTAKRYRTNMTTMQNRDSTITIDHVSGTNGTDGRFDFSVKPNGFGAIVVKSVSFADGCKFVAAMLAIPVRPSVSGQFGPPDRFYKSTPRRNQQ